MHKLFWEKLRLANHSGETWKLKIHASNASDKVEHSQKWQLPAQEKWPLTTWMN